MWLFYGLIGLCIVACGLAGVCHWSTCLVVGFAVALGAAGRRYIVEQSRRIDNNRYRSAPTLSNGTPPLSNGDPTLSNGDQNGSKQIPASFRRMGAVAAVSTFASLCAIDALRHIGFQAAVLSSFLNLVWALLVYRSFCNDTLSDRLQAAVLSILPLACLAFSMPTLEYAAFLVVYIAVLFAFFAFQALTRPNSGVAGDIVASQSQSTTTLSKSPIRRRVQRGGAVVAAVAAVCLVSSLLFLIMPRYRAGEASPGTGMARQATAAFPDVSLDKTGKIDLDPSLVFRANVPEIPDTRYWIIDTHNSFDGTTWHNTFSYQARETPERVSAPVYRLEFVRDWYDWRLPVLRHTTGVRRLEDDDSRARFYVDPYDDYRRRGWPPAISGFEFGYDTVRRAPTFDAFQSRDIWPNRHPNSSSYRKLHRTALRITDGANTNREKAQRIVDYLQKNYAYSLDRPVRSGFVVEDFLFEQKFGHCEIFSTAMAVLLSTLDIGVRNVSGFASSEYRNGYHLVRAAHAHSWVEVQLDDGSWQVFDPTPAGPAQIKPSWRVRLNDWFDSYRSDKFYRWVDAHWALSIIALLAAIAAFFVVRRAIEALRLRLQPPPIVMQIAWNRFIDAIPATPAIASKNTAPKPQAQKSTGSAPPAIASKTTTPEPRSQKSTEYSTKRREKIPPDAIDPPINAFEWWYECYRSDDSAIGRFVRANIATRFMPNDRQLTGFARFRFNSATLQSMRNAQREWLRRKR